MTKEDISAWVEKAQTLFDDSHHPHEERLQFTIGKKYARVYRETDGAFCFIDLSNGDILKAETWKRPAKHARGNIYAENPLEGVDWHGAKYLR